MSPRNGLTRRGPAIRRIGVAVAIVAMFMFAGCAGTSTEAETPQSTVAVKKSEVPSGTGGDKDAVGKAVVRGQVIDPEGFVIPEALVIILSVDGSVLTDNNGSFIIYGVEAGEQTIRIEKQDYNTVVQTIDVPASSVVDVEAVLVPSTNLNPGFRNAHIHDYWGDSDRFVVLEDSFSWPEPTPTGIECPPSNVEYNRDCTILDISLEAGQLIPPGTKEVEFTLDWTPTPFAPLGTYGEYVYLYAIQPPTEEYPYNKYNLIRPEPGVTQTLVVEEGAADNGHAAFTSWQFYIYWSSTVGAYATEVYNEMRSDMDLKIEAIKGELTLDPPHPRFWKDTDRIYAERGMGYLFPNKVELPREPPANHASCYYGCVRIPSPAIVPPGTTHIEVNFTQLFRPSPADNPVTQELNAEFVPNFQLGYKDAAGKRSGLTWDDYVWLSPDETEVGDNGWDQLQKYRFSLKGMGTDGFYDRLSGGHFYLYQPGGEKADTWQTCPYAYATYTCGYYYFYVEATFVNENRDEQLEAGLA